MKKTTRILLATALIGFTTMLHAQVAINNSATTPDASAILDLKSGNAGVNKGFLPQAIALTATNAAAPVSSPATGLIVYNTATAGSPPNNVVPGYYYWTGSVWALLLAPGVGTMGQVLTSNGGGAPNWSTPDTGSVTSFSSGNLPPLFTTTVTNPTTTPALSFTLSNAGAYTILGNDSSTSAAPAYFSPILASPLFQNQGTVTTVLHGNAAGNPSWGAVNLATDVTNNLPITNLDSGKNANANTFWSGNGTWVAVTDSADNGLSDSANTVQLGGNKLLHNTSIPLNSHKLTIAGSSDTNTFAATGQVGVGTTSPNPAAVLDVSSTTQGFLPPRLTSAQIAALPNLAVGLVIYNTSTHCLQINYTGAASGWASISCLHGTYSAIPGQINTWNVPGGVTSITITSSGAAGGNDPDYTTGGPGTTFTQAFTVNPGDVLSLAPGMQGGVSSCGGGGGGSFVYDNTSSTLLMAAGGGGGAGYSSGDNGGAGSLTVTPTNGSGGNGAGGSGGGPSSGGAAGSGTGSGGGGAGWGENGANYAGTDPTNGGNDWTNLLTGVTGYSGFGGFGGGGAASKYGGGGGGGYNGGGGANGTNDAGGGGGGSGYWNGASFVSPVSATASNTGNGSITVTY